MGVIQLNTHAHIDYINKDIGHHTIIDMQILYLHKYTSKHYLYIYIQATIR